MPWEINSSLVILIFVIVAGIGIFSILKWTKNKTRKISHLRLFIQILAVVVIFMGLIIGPFGTSRWLPLGISPREVYIMLTGKDI